MGITTKTTTQPMKIDEIGARDFVLELLKNRKTATAVYIAGAIERKFNTKIHPHSVRKFIKNARTAQTTIAKRDDRDIKKLEHLALDYKKELIDTLDEVKELKQYAKDNKDLASFSNLVGRVFQAIELFAKIQGDLSQAGQIDINVIYDSVAQKIATEKKETRGMLTGKDFDVKHAIELSDKRFIAELRGMSDEPVVKIDMKKGD